MVLDVVRITSQHTYVEDRRRIAQAVDLGRFRIDTAGYAFDFHAIPTGLPPRHDQVKWDMNSNEG